MWPLVRDRSTPKIVALAVLGLLVATAVVVFAALSGGRYDSFPIARLSTDAERDAAPRWTRPCRPAGRDAVATTCARVRGRVVWVERTDPDGDGDRHLLVVSQLDTRIVKLAADFRVGRLPALGSEVTATGPVVPGGSGRPEIRTERFEVKGRRPRAADGQDPRRRRPIRF